MVQPLQKLVWRIPKNVKIELSYDPVIPVLGSTHTGTHKPRSESQSNFPDVSKLEAKLGFSPRYM